MPSAGRRLARPSSVIRAAIPVGTRKSRYSSVVVPVSSGTPDPAPAAIAASG